jgi:Undecaprenyl-phosphate glucose phosphotransferase
MSSIASIKPENEFLRSDSGAGTRRSIRFSFSNGVLILSSIVADCLAFVASMTVGRAIYSGLHLLSEKEIGSGLMALMAFCLIANSLGLYRFHTLLTPGRVLTRVGGAALVGALVAYVVLLLLESGNQYLQKVVLAFAVLGPVFVLLERVFFGFAARAAVRLGLVKGRRVVLITESDELERIGLWEFVDAGVEVLSPFVLSLGEGSSSLSSGDVETVKRAIGFARQTQAAEFAVVLPWSRDRALLELTALLRSSPLPARLYPDRRIRSLLGPHRVSDVDPYSAVELQRAPLNRSERLVKRALDSVIAALALVILMPLLLSTALLVKMDSSGPAIFRQRRRGFDNREFMIWKFRTMHVMEDGGKVQQARRKDARFTSIGAVLRKTSIDELPQLVNVLRGEMSLVGPRPHAVAHDEEFGSQIDSYAFRHHVKPGITGYAQVCGYRGETRSLMQMEKRIEHDLWYINNWSFGLDLKIMMRTFMAVLQNDAY